ncbi:MAG: rhodanese family protein [Parvibaculum sp.]|uniref:rhodanese family protein n=1 Tax=Parvibaculum sp. TaxID=2024848 RepID=UPI00284CCB24|nr:rhodanese family protein [Parvibaculum sp.]MDR3498023.1 rhodanese family protein [Parvibaculum sp.]
MTLKVVSAAEAKALKDRGAAIVDIREPDEFAREHIPGAKNAPLSKIDRLPQPKAGEIVVYHCKSGMRTQANAARLPSDACDAYILEGGLEGWKTAGLPVAVDTKQPMELMRQVQISAGSLVLVGVFLGATLHPAFYALSAFAGAGLVVAGVTGFCGMARFLALMPWNRRAARG